MRYLSHPDRNPSQPDDSEAPSALHRVAASLNKMFGGSGQLKTGLPCSLIWNMDPLFFCFFFVCYLCLPPRTSIPRDEGDFSSGFLPSSPDVDASRYPAIRRTLTLGSASSP
ncbi:hypothetical protein AVEN_130301-1 [Araneus ventricosus]|uniref:Uncharacterized protein n=1 Tax=Araneus ventricosus TaxID=182803 RepID=A0A4Y2U3M8_ARAVE|nr:hypothetical protein AVEN_60620-1 [Araneus ventricosus]GBO07212.1 hypothetical protein AVEN_123827-1 [Araneus ventricosus]GBO37074.1 hypothetical protein AVEN_6206-1 [Araneus ventricosus]GBO37077.1 hypothetical protein AVEN_130301-1 [Araneus ventricosus]